MSQEFSDSICFKEICNLLQKHQRLSRHRVLSSECADLAETNCPHRPWRVEPVFSSQVFRFIISEYFKYVHKFLYYSYSIFFYQLCRKVSNQMPKIKNLIPSCLSSSFYSLPLCLVCLIFWGIVFLSDLKCHIIIV